MENVLLDLCSTEVIPQVALEIIKRFPQHRIFAFYGEMGAGKTTLIKEICRQMGVKEDEMSSPTFSLVNEYVSSGSDPVYHFDFYRIKKESEAFDLGYEEYFFSGNFCFIEWPEKIETLLPEMHVKVNIKISDNCRKVEIMAA